MNPVTQEYIHPNTSIATAWTIFPIHPVGPDGACACGRGCTAKPGKHPAVRWSQLEPGEKAPIPEGFNAGLVTGEKSGVVIIDLDPPEGATTLLGLGDPRVTLTARTPRGGLHLYYQYPGRHVVSTAGELGSGVDVRGDGGMVVLPGSRGPGGVYEWINEAPIAPLPEWLEPLLRAGRKAAPAGSIPESNGITTEDGWKIINKIANAVRAIPEGQRNGRLHALSAKLGDFVWTGEVDVEDARKALRTACNEWSPRDVRKDEDTIERGLRGSSKDKLVQITTNHKEMNDRAVELLSLRDDVYILGNLLSWDIGDGLSIMTKSNLKEALSSSVEWVKQGKEGLIRTDPPDDSVSEIFDRGHWPALRSVKGTSDVPILRPDSTVTEEAGWDPATGVFVRDAHPLVPMSVPEAVAILREVVCDFPFRSESDLSGWVCALLTPLAMYAFEGPIPLMLFEASAAGSGKTLLATISSLIATGEVASPTQYTVDNTEMRKAITTWAMEPKPVMLLDNVGGALGGDALNSWVTSPNRFWSDRMLGGNRKFRGVVNTTIFATANQASLGPDMGRRIVVNRLEPNVERPEKRGGWRHNPLLPWVREMAPVIRSACFAILQGPAAPGAVGDEWGSFEGWRHTVLSKVVGAGLASPVEATEETRESGSDDDDITEFVRLWKLVTKGLPAYAKDVWNLLYPPVGFPKGDDVVALRTHIEAKYSNPTQKSLGNCIRKAVGVFTSEGQIKKQGSAKGYARWAIG